jgi:hypothetical protein
MLGVTQFLPDEGKKPANIYYKMKHAYDDMHLSKEHVCKWVQQLNSSVQKFDDVLRPGHC